MAVEVVITPIGQPTLTVDTQEVNLFQVNQTYAQKIREELLTVFRPEEIVIQTGTRESIINFVNQQQPKLFLVLEQAISDNQTDRGFQIFQSGASNSIQLANRILSKTQLNRESFNLPDHADLPIFIADFRQSGDVLFDLIVDTTPPAVAMDIGFITNPFDRQIILDPGFQDRFSSNIAIAMIEFIQSGQKIANIDPAAGLTFEEVAQIAFRVWNDKETAIIATAIAKAESNLNPTAGGDSPQTLINIRMRQLEQRGSSDIRQASIELARKANCPKGTDTGPASWGLWQIFVPVHTEKIRRFSGLSDSCDQAIWLQNPENNAQIAFDIYRDAGNSFQPWSTFKNGLHERWLDEARTAMNAVLDTPQPPSDEVPPMEPLPSRRIGTGLAFGAIAVGGILFFMRGGE